MSNECWRVIILHALTEIHKVLQIEENISISHQTLRYTGKGMVAVHFLPESQFTQEGTGKVIHKPSVLDEKSSNSNRIG